MNIQEKQARLNELEQIVANEEKKRSKRSFDSWTIFSDEYHEMIELRTEIKNAQAQATKTQRANNGGWRNDQATQAQLNYLARLNVQAEPNMTKGRASQLIDAAKNGELGSVGGWYIDGSN